MTKRRCIAPSTRRRLVAGVIGTLMLLTSSVTATAAEDPGPREWPTVEKPSNTGGDTSDDPKPADWPDVAPPDPGRASDPKPKEWPAPEPA